MSILVLIRGGGDLASGVALRLHRAGLQVLITELAQPQAVRRTVSFAQAVYSGEVTIEGVTARRVENPAQAFDLLQQGNLPVLVDPGLKILGALRDRAFPVHLDVLVDGRMIKRAPEIGMEAAPLVIGLGPGFVAGENCHAVIETNRGHFLGRVIWQGTAQADTGIPERVSNQAAGRVLRSPAEGRLEAYLQIGDSVEAGQPIAKVAGQEIRAPFRGVLRGLIQPGFLVKAGMKVGDVDPRGDALYSRLVSDKALAIGGGVLEAILYTAEMRSRLCDESRGAG